MNQYRRYALFVFSLLLIVASWTAHGEGIEDDGSRDGPAKIGKVRVERDISYGNDARQRFDVYLPSNPHNAPVIFMVHGGGWARGDKTGRTVVENKMARWVQKGFVFISVNYRLLPTTPMEQAEDVARALAAAQERAGSWGADRNKFVLMGHSAGAHLVSVLAASPAIATQLGASPWLGTVSLDSAALDVVGIMEKRHLRLYDRAFGRDPEKWKAASPYHLLAKAPFPFLAVCSTRRNDSCPHAKRFVEKAISLGGKAEVLGQPLSHKDINQNLGLAGSYTDSVESFLNSLDPVFAAATSSGKASPR